MKGVKLLVTGLESSGKSTITSEIKDALVINFDNKEYNFEVANADFREYTGLDSVINFINNKLVAYKEKNGKFPKVLVIDTVTQLYSSMVLYNSKKYTGFNIHSQNNVDTLDLNNYFEDVILANGVDLVVVAHAIFDPDTKAYTIKSQGQFRDAGSWLSIVNDSIFIEKRNGKLTVFLNDIKYPSRTSLEKIEEKMSIDDYDINTHLEKLRNSKETIQNKFKL